MKKVITLLMLYILVISVTLTGCSSDKTAEIKNELNSVITDNTNNQITNRDIWINTEDKNEVLMMTYMIKEPYLIPILAEEISPIIKKYSYLTPFLIIQDDNEPITMWSTTNTKEFDDLYGMFTIKGKLETAPYDIKDLKEYFSDEIEKNSPS